MVSKASYILIACLLSATFSAAQQKMELQARDGLTVHAWSYETQNSPFTIILYHQAGSNALAEYSGIAGRLVSEGYSVFMIDQRKGGSRLGGENLTAAAVDEEALTYCDAYPDLEAALTHVSGTSDKKVVVWGSSYSAALVLKLGIEHKDKIRAVLAFSPASGGPMGTCSANNFIEELTIPTFALRPGNEAEIESVSKQLELFQQNGIRTYVAPGGVHGSSMLNPNRASDTEATWTQVLNFLNSVD